MDERDVLISPEYLAELKERLNDKISVPQVFINGQHIGVRMAKKISKSASRSNF